MSRSTVLVNRGGRVHFKTNHPFAGEAMIRSLSLHSIGQVDEVVVGFVDLTKFPSKVARWVAESVKRKAR